MQTCTEKNVKIIFPFGRFFVSKRAMFISKAVLAICLMANSLAFAASSNVSSAAVNVPASNISKAAPVSAQPAIQTPQNHQQLQQLMRSPAAVPVTPETKAAPTKAAVPASVISTSAAVPAAAPKLQAPAPTASAPVPTNSLGQNTSPSSLAPAPPAFDVKAYTLLDADSGYIIVSKNATEHLPPASITKLMSLYLIANALKTNQLHFTDMVPISENAWRKGGSKMFIKVGAQIPVKDLIDGIVIASGNDATVAMAEYMAGSEETFVNLMNQTAAKIGMKDSHFVDSNGLPAQDHYSSANDIGSLARAWIAAYPEFYPWFKQKWITFNGIKQANRNRLLWHDSSVDGIKTGHTDEAGYCLVASAVRNGTRLIAVILGAPNDSTRMNAVEGLLNYGFRFYETHKLNAAGTAITKAKVWMGKKNEVELGVAQDLAVTVPTGQYQALTANINVVKPLKAPIQKGQVYGSIDIMLNGKLIASQPLVALDTIPRSNFISAFIDRIMLLFYH